MTFHIDEPVDQIWSPLFVLLAGGLLAIPTVTLIAFGILALAG